jgi:hypothetical protein
MAADRSPSAVQATCKQVLGAELATALEATAPHQWYPASSLVSMLQAIEAKIGQNGLRRVGRSICQRSYADKLVAQFRSVDALLSSLDALYRRSNRGQDIGGWKLQSFAEAEARIEYSAPYSCLMQEGMVAEACAVIGCPVLVSQRECVRTGAGCCVFSIVSTPK